MRHLILSREYPPAPYAPGGIGAYVANISQLLAERGETVHVIAQRWDGAPKALERFIDGRLIVHRIGAEDIPGAIDAVERERFRQELEGLKGTAFPNQWFSWHAARVAERLIAAEGIEVIEGQEWEAPLYYLLLRRALGLAVPPYPPCIVHLHSATEFIRHYNGEYVARPDYLPMKRMETFCIQAADALLSPSQYYAAQCAERFGVPRSRINVIPLPIGATPALARNNAVWEHGSICFLGRIEPRKGIIEWMTAAARVASERSDVCFDFVGADVCGLQSVLWERLDPALRPRFRFHGSKSREGILRYLAAATAAVVPSRWENFPNVCIEAMRSGLPVIATRMGGMVELIEDGKSGWLLPDTGVAGMVDGLAAALRRCLEATAAERAAMGAAASAAVAGHCDNAAIVEAHIAWRREVAEGNARRSSSLFHAVRGGEDAAPVGIEVPVPTDRGAGIVVRGSSLEGLRRILDSLAWQTCRPSAVAVVIEGNAAAAISDSTWAPLNPIWLPSGPAVGTAAWNAGFMALQRDGIRYWLFLDEHDVLDTQYLERLAKVFDHDPRIGVIAPWTLRTTGVPTLEAPLCADLAYQLIGNDVTPASAFRAEALDGSAPFRPGLPREYDLWDLANAVLLKGWLVAVLPAALTVRHQSRPCIYWPEVTALRALRTELLGAFTASTSRLALTLVDDYVPVPWGSPQPRLSGEPLPVEIPRSPARRLWSALRCRLRPFWHRLRHHLWRPRRRWRG